jgi:hypothetical protein
MMCVVSGGIQGVGVRVQQKHDLGSDGGPGYDLKGTQKREIAHNT